MRRGRASEPAVVAFVIVLHASGSIFSTRDSSPSFKAPLARASRLVANRFEMRTWTWRCRCGLHHSTAVLLQLAPYMLSNQHGSMITEDGQNDICACDCVMMFMWAPRFPLFPPLLDARGIDRAMLYSFAPVMLSTELIDMTATSLPATREPISLKILVSTHVLELNSSRELAPLPVRMPSQNRAWLSQIKSWHKFLRQTTGKQIPNLALMTPLELAAAAVLRDVIIWD